MKLRTSARAALATAAAVGGLALTPGTAGAHAETTDGCIFQILVNDNNQMSGELANGGSGCRLHVVATCKGSGRQIADLAAGNWDSAHISDYQCGRVDTFKWKHFHSFRKH